MMDNDAVASPWFEHVFATFLAWVAARPDAQEVQAALQVLNDLLGGSQVQPQVAYEAAVSLVQVAYAGPHADILVPAFEEMCRELASAL